MKEKLMRQIIAKYKELDAVRCEQILTLVELVAIDKYSVDVDSLKSLYVANTEDARKLNNELVSIKQQLESVDIAEIKATPIPSGWICPRCQKVHNWMVQHCDCPANVITASTTEPIDVPTDLEMVNAERAYPMETYPYSNVADLMLNADKINTAGKGFRDGAKWAISEIIKRNQK